ncbi:MAG TPA: GAF domain-containing protein [Thermoplasmata archaeon]
MLRALEVVSDRVSAVDKDYTIVFMNSRMKNAVGNLVGKKCHDTVLGSPEMCSKCFVRSDWDFSKGPLRTVGSDSEGNSYELVVSKFVDPSSADPYWICIERDITEQSETQKKLKMLMESLDQMADAVCVTDPNGQAVYVNKAYTQLTGYDDSHVASLSMTSVSDNSSNGSTMLAMMKAANEKPWHGEMTGVRKDGARYYVSVDAKPVQNDNGKTMAIVAILQDVTRAKSEKVQFERYASELEAKMEARTTELARKVSQLTTINKISRVVTSILDLDELMGEFVKSIAQGFGFRHVIVMMMDKERGELYYRAGYGPNIDSVPKDMRQKLKEGLVGQAAYFGETLVSDDVESDSRYVRKELIGTKSEVSVPVSFRGEILGVLDVQSDQKHAFTRNDVNLLEMLADMLANTVTNARTYMESKEREAALSVLDRISKQISYRLEPNVLLDQVARDAASLLRAEKAWIGLLEEGSGKVSWVASYKVERDKLKYLSFDAKQGVTGRALKWLKTEVVNDYAADPDAFEDDRINFGIRSMVSAPLIIEGKGIGVINAYNKLGNQLFTRSDALFLSSLADHVAIALENSSLLSSLNQRVHSQLALLETAISMQRQIDSSSIYELVADKLREVVWYNGLAFYKLDKEKGLLGAVLARGPYSREIMTEKFPLGSGITGFVAKTGRAELLNDVSADPRAVQVPGTPVEKEALMAIPLKGKDQILGVLALYRTGDARFTDAEFEIARLFASHASVAVENAELYRSRELSIADSRSKVDQMANVLELTTSVMYMDDMERLLQRVVDVIVASFGFKRAAIGILDRDRDEFVLRALSGYPDWVTKGSAKPVDMVLHDMNDKCKVSGSCYYSRFEGQDYDVSDFWFLANPERAAEPRASPDSWHERDVVLFALRDRSGALIGFMNVDEPNDLRIPSQDKFEVLEILAGICSIASENAKMYEKQVLAANEVALLNDLMTHDINNFTQGIMGYLELLLQDKRLDENQRRYADRALLQVRNNARIIDNVRKLTKVRMMTDADLVPVDLQASIAEAIDAVTKANPGRKMTIVSSLLSDRHYVRANSYLFDLFHNVISNAVKFDSSGRIKVDIRVEEERASYGEYWVVSVADHGRGIPDDRKQVVFERFATGVTGVKGFGLGLSIVKSIVEKFNGRIWVEDRVKGDSSKGTVFRISLPKAHPDGQPKPEE